MQAPCSKSLQKGSGVKGRGGQEGPRDILHCIGYQGIVRVLKILGIVARVERACGSLGQQGVAPRWSAIYHSHGLNV